MTKQQPASTPKRGRGRPRKIPLGATPVPPAPAPASSSGTGGTPTPARRRGRPPKNRPAEVAITPVAPHRAAASPAAKPAPALAGAAAPAAAAARAAVSADEVLARWLRSPAEFNRTVPTLRVTVDGTEMHAVPSGISWFTAPTAVDVRVGDYVVHTQATVTVTLTGLDLAK